MVLRHALGAAGSAARGRVGRACLVLATIAVWATQAGAAAPLAPPDLPGAEAFPPALRTRLTEALAAREAGSVPRTRHRHLDGRPRYTNRLILEASPYLQQHAHNPVDWRPWGAEAFAAARRLGRPVLVSIGYSTCHWCHVMEEESFDDPEVARVLNQGFVTIKVDREVRPDVDEVYMSAVHALGQRGGWPLNVWLTPDGEPFYGGTYFPPANSAGRPGFVTVLNAISQQYAADPVRIAGMAARVTQAVQQRVGGSAAYESRAPQADWLARAARAHLARADPEWGGVRGRPKFPSSLPVRFLLRFHRRSGDPAALAVAERTLERMARGGLRDQIGGGFHRYATDERWLVPHFEKMLYDNALLAITYLEGWQVTQRAEFADVVRSTLDALLRDMRLPDGGFASATDADSPDASGESLEGAFFTWTPAEVRAAAGPDLAPLALAHYGVTAAGHLEGRSVLHASRPLAEVAAGLGIPAAEAAGSLEAVRQQLFEARERRPPPHRDDKRVLAWNALAVSAFARAGFALAEPAYVEVAAQTADFLLGKLRVDGRLRRVFQAGRAEGQAFLDDHAFLVAALLDLYEARPEPRWLEEAVAVQALLDRHYADPGGGYFQVAADRDDLLARPKPMEDGALPSGNSVSALNLLRLQAFTERPEYGASLALLWSAFAARLEQQPTAYGELWLALDYQLDTPKEIVVVRPEQGGDVDALLAPLRRQFVPNRIVSVVRQGPELDAHAPWVPLVAGRVARGGRDTAYVCENRVCGYPTEDPATFAEQIGQVAPLPR